MTTRADAVEGLRYFDEVRDIAAQVGVEVPSPADIERRFAATDSVDLEALAADARMLGSVVSSVTGAVDTAYDARAAIPDAWRGHAADAADAAVAGHVSTADHAVDRIRSVSGAVTAAAIALARVQSQAFATLAALRAEHPAGLPITDLRTDELDDLAPVVIREVTAAVSLFTKTMDTVDDAMNAILTALTGSFADLPQPVRPGPAMRQFGPERPRVARRQRTDVIATPAVLSYRIGSPVDPQPVTAAIAAAGTIAGAAIAAVSAVSTAAVGGIGMVVDHLADAVDGPGARAPYPLDDPTDITSGHLGVPTPPTQPTPGSETVLGDRETDTIPSRRTVPGAAEPDAPAPRPPAGPDMGDSVGPRPPGGPAPADDVADRDAAPASDHRVPHTQRTRPRDAPRWRADPDDGGGLALAGER